MLIYLLATVKLISYVCAQTLVFFAHDLIQNPLGVNELYIVPE